jgi:hypothetical protein
LRFPRVDRSEPTAQVAQALALLVLNEFHNAPLY